MVINNSNGRGGEYRKSDTILHVCFISYMIFICIAVVFYLLLFIENAFSLGHSFDNLIGQPLFQLGGELLFCISQLAYLILLIILLRLYIHKELTKKFRLYWYVTILFLIPEMYLAFTTIVLLIGGFDLHF